MTIPSRLIKPAFIKGPAPEFFWIQSKPHRGATEKEIAQAEQRLEVGFPAAVKRLFHIQNGGHTRFASVDKPYRSSEKLVFIDSIWPIEEWRNLEMLHWEGWGDCSLPDAEKLIAFSSHCARWVCLDYRRSMIRPGAAIIELDRDPVIQLLAPSFEAFQRSLIYDGFHAGEGSYFGLGYKRGDKKRLAAELSASLRCDLEWQPDKYSWFSHAGHFVPKGWPLKLQVFQNQDDRGRWEIPQHREFGWILRAWGGEIELARIQAGLVQLSVSTRLIYKPSAE